MRLDKISETLLRLLTQTLLWVSRQWHYLKMMKMSRFPKPCLTCNQLTTGGSYCDTHQKTVDAKEQQRQAIRKRGRTIYNDGAYRRGRAWLKATATHCHLCKQAFTDRNQITADHLIAGDVNSPLAPAHAICNSRRGNKPIQ